jgi:hypothetical protein
VVCQKPVFDCVEYVSIRVEHFSDSTRHFATLIEPPIQVGLRRLSFLESGDPLDLCLKIRRPDRLDGLQDTQHLLDDLDPMPQDQALQLRRVDSGPPPSPLALRCSLHVAHPTRAAASSAFASSIDE